MPEHVAVTPSGYPKVQPPPVMLPDDPEQGEQGPPGPAGLPGQAGSNGITGSQGPVGPPIFLVGESGEDGSVFIPSAVTASNPGPVVTPAVPATTVAIKNATGRSVTAFIKGGTLTVITLGGVATGIAAAAPASTCHCVPVAENQTIAITYTVAPTWVWIAS